MRNTSVAGGKDIWKTDSLWYFNHLSMSHGERYILLFCSWRYHCTLLLKHLLYMLKNCFLSFWVSVVLGWDLVELNLNSGFKVMVLWGPWARLCGGFSALRKKLSVLILGHKRGQTECASDTADQYSLAVSGHVALEAPGNQKPLIQPWLTIQTR